MENPLEKAIMAQEDFDAMVDDAIGDLHRAGLAPEDIFRIVEGHFGEGYAKKFCRV